MKNIRTNFILLVWVCFYFNIQANPKDTIINRSINDKLDFQLNNFKNYKIANRELIIFFENMSMENIKMTLNSSIDNYSYGFSKDSNPEPAGIGAITGTYLIAMHQEAAPILVSKAIVINALEHKKLFHDFLIFNINQLYNKYYKTEKFNNSSFLKKFKDCCTYTFNRYKQINKEIENFINKNNLYIAGNEINNLVDKKIYDFVKDRRFNQDYAPFLLNEVSSGNYDKIYFEMIVYLICYTIKYSNWVIKELNDDLYLLIPKKYLNTLSLKSSSIKYKNYNNKLRNKLTPTELKLGLKVNHLKDLSFQELINKDQRQFTQDKYKFNTLQAVENLFVNKKYAPSFVWALYCTGHGYYENCANIALAQLEKLQAYYKTNLKADKQNQEYLKNLNLINFEIKRLNLIKQMTIVNDIDLSKGIILSIPKDEFKKLLLFFNNNINTSFLYYTSCYSGGINLIEPYINDKNLKPLIFNYDIVSGTVCENMSMQLMPILNIPPYYHLNNKINISKNSIDFKNKKLKLVTNLHFKKYFKKLKLSNYRNSESLKNIINKLHPYKFNFGTEFNIASICNIPLVRFSGLDYFQADPFKDDNIDVINSKAKFNNEFVNFDKEVSLLYADYIYQPINMSERSCAIISMLPGLAGHVFESVLAPNLELQDVIKPFLYFDEMPAPKIFWIKKLKCKNLNKLVNINQYNTLFNVIIIRNIILTDKLKEGYNLNQYGINAYIYFDCNQNIDQNKYYKAKLNKSDLDFVSLKKALVLCTSKTNYKNEILALNPDIKNYLKDINYFSNNII